MALWERALPCPALPCPQGGKFVGTRLRRFLLPAAPEPAREHGHAGGKLPRLNL